MTSGAGPSGRSPFPASRNPRNRRTSLAPDSFQQHLQEESASHSPFLNNLLRFSPKASISPLGNNGTNRGTNSVTNAGTQPPRRTRFFDSGAPHASAAAAAIRSVDSTSSSNASTTQQQQQQVDITTTTDLQDGIPLEHLKTLAKHHLLSAPEMAAFYAGIVYAKTGTEGLLLAQAHAAAGQYEACLRILEEANLLQQQQQPQRHQGGGDYHYYHYPWDAIIVAAKALSGKRDWNALLELVEDVCRMPSDPMVTPAASAAAQRLLPVSNNTNNNNNNNPLEDSDLIGWMALRRSIKPIVAAAIHPLAMICWFRANAYFETGCGFRAATYWKLALKMDCQCQPAWDAIQNKKLLSPKEAHDLVTHEIEFAPEHDWLRSFYLARIEVTTQDVPFSSSPLSLYNTLSTTAATGEAKSNMDMMSSSSELLLSPIPSVMSPDNNNSINAYTNKSGKRPVAAKNVGPANQIQADVSAAFTNLWDKHKLQHSPQILAMAARRAYRNYDWKKALEYCQYLAQLDPSMSEAAFCYVSSLVILGHKRVLFRLAHKWVEAAPKSARAWFAVGAYYYCIERYHVAQRHFSRATRLDPQCSEAWIAFGCSFAACDESDQALASFRAAHRLSPGDHSALMYMGMEYVRTNHLPLATHFLESALVASAGDPLCLHELGVLCMQKGNNDEEAISWFRRALSAAFGKESIEECIELCNDPYWEPTLFNLGHCYRRQHRFDEAETCYRRCNALCPNNHSSLSALAFVNLHKNQLDKSIEYLHKALSVKPNDSLSTDILGRILKLQVAVPVRKTDLRALKSRDNKRHVKPTFAVSSVWGLKDDSLMSEGADSDIDMSGDSQ